MELFVVHGDDHRLLGFQYPLSDRVGWNTIPAALKTLADFSFSILYRIELGGTNISRSSVSHWLNFQYPLSDRVGWNSSGCATSKGWARLSVSSIGSSWVERLEHLKNLPSYLSFSILYRIELGGTKPAPAGIAQFKRLSVSSIGSSWVELENLLAVDPHEFSFSILYRIELGGTLPV